MEFCNCGCTEFSAGLASSCKIGKIDQIPAEVNDLVLKIQLCPFAMCVFGTFPPTYLFTSSSILVQRHAQFFSHKINYNIHQYTYYSRKQKLCKFAHCGWVITSPWLNVEIGTQNLCRIGKNGAQIALCSASKISAQNFSVTTCKTCTGLAALMIQIPVITVTSVLICNYCTLIKYLNPTLLFTNN